MMARHELRTNHLKKGITVKEERLIDLPFESIATYDPFNFVNSLIARNSDGSPVDMFVRTTFHFGLLSGVGQMSLETLQRTYFNFGQYDEIGN
jgi:hypothetical protein